MRAKYYTLAMRRHNRWCIEFGSYDRATVKSEFQDYRDHGVKAKDLRIVESGDHQADIDAAMDRLNYAEAINASR